MRQNYTVLYGNKSGIFGQILGFWIFLDGILGDFWRIFWVNLQDLWRGFNMFFIQFLFFFWRILEEFLDGFL